ncbi:MAG: ABC transporter permease, partial [Bacilli bacterium]
MKQMINLLKGELVRLYKYKVLITSLFVSVIWVVVVALADKAAALMLSPMLIWMDGAMMSILFIAASYYFEKQEQTIKSLLVSPVSISQILISKVIASLLMGLISGVFVVSYSMLVYHLEVKLVLLFIYILIVVASHTAFGFLITLYSKDFGAMLVNYILFAFLTVVPSMLLTANIIPESFSTIMLISPTHAGKMLIESAFTSHPIG